MSAFYYFNYYHFVCLYPMKSPMDYLGIVLFVFELLHTLSVPSIWPLLSPEDNKNLIS